MELLPTIFKFAGWLPYVAAVVFAGLQFGQSYSSKTSAEALSYSLMMFVNLVVLIMVASAIVYQIKNEHFSFRDAASEAFICAAASALAFSAWVIVSERFEMNAVRVSVAGFFLGVPMFWIGFVFLLYVGPRVVGYR